MELTHINKKITTIDPYRIVKKHKPSLSINSKYKNINDSIKTRINNSSSKINQIQMYKLKNQQLQTLCCGGIKLILKAKETNQKNNKIKKYSSKKLLSKSKQIKDCVVTDPISFQKIQNVKKQTTSFTMRVQSFQTNPQSSKILTRIPRIPYSEIIFPKNSKNNIKCGLYSKQNMLVSLYPINQIKKLKLHHKNIIQAIGIWQNQKTQKQYYVTRYYEKNQYGNMIMQFGKLGLKFTKKVIRQILMGILHMNKLLINHNRLTPQNIIFTDQGQIIINYYKSSNSHLSQNQKKKYYHFFPPEQLLSRSNLDHQKNDVWAIGCLTLMTIFGQNIKDNPLHPYNKPTLLMNQSQSSQMIKKIQQIFGCPYQIEQQYSNKVNKYKKKLTAILLQFTSKCLSINIERRPTIEQLLSYRFMQIEITNF